MSRRIIQRITDPVDKRQCFEDSGQFGGLEFAESQVGY